MKKKKVFSRKKKYFIIENNAPNKQEKPNIYTMSCVVTLDFKQDTCHECDQYKSSSKFKLIALLLKVEKDFFIICYWNELKQGQFIMSIKVELTAILSSFSI